MVDEQFAWHGCWGGIRLPDLWLLGVGGARL